MAALPTAVIAGLGGMLLIMVAAFTLTFYWLLLRRLQAEIVEREGDARWIRELVGQGSANMVSGMLGAYQQDWSGQDGHLRSPARTR